MDTQAAAGLPYAGTGAGQGQAGQAAAAAPVGGAEGVEVPLLPWPDAEGCVSVDLLELRSNWPFLVFALGINVHNWLYCLATEYKKSPHLVWLLRCLKEGLCCGKG